MNVEPFTGLRRFGRGWCVSVVLMGAVLLSLTSSYQAVADTASQQTLERIVKLTSLFQQHALSPQSAASVLGVDAVIRREGKGWIVTAPESSVKCILRAESIETVVDMADVHLMHGQVLTLDDVRRVLGQWQLVHSSKTSSVSFQLGPESGEGVAMIFARVLAQRPSADSPVSSLAFRRVQHEPIKQSRKDMKP